jgi:hypothetical protein
LLVWTFHSLCSLPKECMGPLDNQTPTYCGEFATYIIHSDIVIGIVDNPSTGHLVF